MVRIFFFLLCQLAWLTSAADYGWHTMSEIESITFNEWCYTDLGDPEIHCVGEECYATPISTVTCLVDENSLQFTCSPAHVWEDKRITKYEVWCPGMEHGQIGLPDICRLTVLLERTKPLPPGTGPSGAKGIPAYLPCKRCRYTLRKDKPVWKQSHGYGMTVLK